MPYVFPDSVLALNAAEGKEITITGNTCSIGGVFANQANTSLSGKVIIKDNIGTSTGKPANLATVNPITVGTLAEGAKIHAGLVTKIQKATTGVLTSGYIENNSGATVSQFFTYDGPDTYTMVLNADGDNAGELEVVKSYAITNGAEQTDEATNHGYLTIDKTTAAENDTVTITVTASDGYKLKENSLKVTYNDGSQDQTRQLTQDTQDKTKYTFTMPAYAVTVSAEFEEAASPAITTWSALQEAITGAGETPTTITLTQSLTATDQDSYLEIKKGQDITIDLAGHTLDRGLKNQNGRQNGHIISINCANLTLKNGTLTGGNAGSYLGGGAIMVSSVVYSPNMEGKESSLTLENCTFKDNSCSECGGAVCFYGSNLKISAAHLKIMIVEVLARLCMPWYRIPLPSRSMAISEP